MNNSEDNIVIGRRIQKLMNSENLSRAEMAQLAGVTLAVIGQWIRGDRRPTLDSLIALANHFDVSIDWICGRGDDKAANRPNAAQKALDDSEAMFYSWCEAITESASNRMGPLLQGFKDQLVSAIDTIAQLKDKIDELEEQNKSLIETQTSLREQIDDLEAHINAVEDQVSEWDPRNVANWESEE